MLTFLLFILLVFVIVTDTPLEKKLQENAKNLWEAFLELINPYIMEVREKFFPVKWEYANSWLSKGNRVLHIRLEGPNGESKHIKYSCTQGGYAFRDERGQYIWDDALFSQERLEELWQDCLTNNRYKDAN